MDGFATPATWPPGPASARATTSPPAAKTVVAIEHTLLTIVWTMLRTGEMSAELGLDYDARRDPSAPRPAPCVSSSRSATT